MKNFIDFIGIWENSLSEVECKQFVDFYNLCENKNLTASSTQDLNPANYRDRQDNHIRIPNHIGLLSDAFPEQLVSKYWNVIGNCLTEYQTKYPNSNIGNLTSYNWNIHRVMPGEGYHVFHSEQDFLTTHRQFVWMTYMHIPNSGGETEFLHQNLRIQPEIGKTLIWPAQWTHTHRGNPPLDGLKVYATGWFSLMVS